MKTTTWKTVGRAAAVAGMALWMQGCESFYYNEEIGRAHV